jgi:hypothetical protein
VPEGLALACAPHARSLLHDSAVDAWADEAIGEHTRHSSAACTSSLRPDTMVAEGLVHSGLRPSTLVASGLIPDVAEHTTNQHLRPHTLVA